MFTQEGNFAVNIRKAVLAEPKFAAPPAFDICVFVETLDGSQGDWYRMEVSQNYGKGNYANRTQAQITAEILQKLGVSITNNDWTQIKKLVGVQTTAFVKESTSEKDGKTYTFYNVKYIGGGGDTPQELDAQNVAQRAAQLFGGYSPPTQQQSQQTQTPFGQQTQSPANNPFNQQPAHA